MIIAIRRYLKGPGFKVVLWVTLFSIVIFWGGPSLLRHVQRRGTGTGPAVASVNGIEISQSEFLRVSNMHEDYLRKIRSQYGQYADLLMQAMGMNTDPKAMALETLVKDSVIDQAAQAMHIHATQGYIDAKFEKPEELTRQLTQILPPTLFERDGSINPAALNKYMAHQRMSNDDLNNLIKDALDRELALELVEIGSYVPNFAVQEEYLKDSVKKKYSIMTLDMAPLLKKEQARAVPDEEIKRYFDPKIGFLSAIGLLNKGRVRPGLFQPINLA